MHWGEQQRLREGFTASWRVAGTAGHGGTGGTRPAGRRCLVTPADGNIARKLRFIYSDEMHFQNTSLALLSGFKNAYCTGFRQIVDFTRIFCVPVLSSTHTIFVTCKYFFYLWKSQMRKNLCETFHGSTCGPMLMKAGLYFTDGSVGSDPEFWEVAGLISIWANI